MEYPNTTREIIQARMLGVGWSFLIVVASTLASLFVVAPLVEIGLLKLLDLHGTAPQIASWLAAGACFVAGAHLAIPIGCINARNPTLDPIDDSGNLLRIAVFNHWGKLIGYATFSAPDLNEINHIRSSTLYINASRIGWQDARGQEMTDSQARRLVNETQDDPGKDSTWWRFRLPSMSEVRPTAPAALAFTRVMDWRIAQPFTEYPAPDGHEEQPDIDLDRHGDPLLWASPFAELRCLPRVFLFLTLAGVFLLWQPLRALEQAVGGNLIGIEDPLSAALAGALAVAALVGAARNAGRAGASSDPIIWVNEEATWISLEHGSFGAIGIPRVEIAAVRGPEWWRFASSRVRIDLRPGGHLCFDPGDPIGSYWAGDPSFRDEIRDDDGGLSVWLNVAGVGGLRPGARVARILAATARSPYTFDES